MLGTVTLNNFKKLMSLYCGL